MNTASAGGRRQAKKDHRVLRYIFRTLLAILLVAAALVAGLEEIMDNMGRCVEDPDRVRDFIDNDHAFHSRIIEFIGVEEFQAEFQKIYFLIRQTSERSLRVKGRSQKVFEEHQRILQSIRAGESLKAYQEMIGHLRVPLHNLAP